MLNQVVLQGRLTKDPELRKTNSQISVVSFSVACERNAKGQDGKYATDFYNCVAWRGTAELISKYFSKGNMILLNGSLQTRDWEDRNGNKRREVEILVDSVYFCEKKSSGSSGSDDFEAIPDDGELPF